MRGKIDFNHISKDLSEEDSEELKELYLSYHKWRTCYKWKYKRLKKLKLLNNMISLTLTSVGVIVGGITINPIILGCISGPGIILQGYIARSGFDGRGSRCKYAYVSYEKTLTLIKSCLNGVPYDEHMLLTELKLIDDFVVDNCPPLRKITKNYDTITTATTSNH